jgi:hypothetical protein
MDHVLVAGRNRQQSRKPFQKEAAAKEMPVPEVVAPVKEQPASVAVAESPVTKKEEQPLPQMSITVKTAPATSSEQTAAITPKVQLFYSKVFACLFLLF